MARIRVGGVSAPKGGRRAERRAIPASVLTTSVRSSPLARAIHSAICRGEAYLRSAQDGDGFWRDYQLPPGSSDAWTSAVALHALTEAPAEVALNGPAVERARAALIGSVTPFGWGYNRVTAADADTTAWCTRALSRSGGLDPERARGWLTAFLDEGGRAATYRSTEGRPGWQAPQPEITPLVGHALLSVGADRDIVKRVRAAVLGSRRPGGAWPSYWWTTEAYAAAWSLRFLWASGGVPPELARDVTDATLRGDTPADAFEAAHRIMTACFGGAAPLLLAEGELACLLDAQSSGDGAWGPCATLLLPSGRWQSGNFGSDAPGEGDAPSPGQSNAADDPYDRAHADVRRIMSTAMAVIALKLALRSMAGWSDGPTRDHPALSSGLDRF